MTQRTLKRVLLATDGSEDAALAANAASHLSVKTGAKLYVAHAWRPVIPRSSFPTVFWSDYTHTYEREARRVLASQVGVVEAQGGVVEEARLPKGSTTDALLDLCEELDPDLVVVGSRGLGRFRRLALGSVSEGIVHHGSNPVLVLRGGSEAWPPRHVIIGEDGSEESWQAALLAMKIANNCDADSVLVQAYQNPPVPIGGWSAIDRRRLDQAFSNQESALDEVAKKLNEGEDSHPEIMLVKSDPAAALLDTAREHNERATLIAVGSRGMSALTRARLGSVSTKVLREATGPVLICPGPYRRGVRHEERNSEFYCARE